MKTNHNRTPQINFTESINAAVVPPASELHGAHQRPPGEEGVEVGADDLEHAAHGLRRGHRPVV